MDATGFEEGEGCAMRAAIALFCCALSGCATVRRHPAITGLVVGAAAGTTIALATRHNCPHVYDGKAYEGTPPCPK